MAAAIIEFGMISPTAADIPVATSNARLKGQYAFAANSACLVSALPFDSNGQPTNPSLTFTGTRSLVGVFTFAGNGHGKAQFKALTILGPPTAATVSEDDSGDFTYTVSGNTVTLTIVNLSITYLTGPETGLTALVDKIRLTGGIATDSRSLTLGGAEPGVETATVSDGSILFSICETGGGLLKM